MIFRTLLTPIPQCRLECSSEYVSECEVCHTLHMRDCTITMTRVMVPR